MRNGTVRFFIMALSLALLNTVAPVAAQVAECDRLAAAPSDKSKPVNVPGVEFDQIDALLAKQACFRAVEQAPNNPRIKYQLARVLSKFKGSEQLVISLYRQAAEKGSLPAVHNLANIYLEGKGVKQSPEEAARLFQKGAEGGFTPSMYALYTRLFSGRGVDKDEAEGLRWLRKCANLEDINCMNRLANIDRDGLPGLIAADLPSARKLWKELSSILTAENEPATDVSNSPFLKIEPGAHVGNISDLATDDAGSIAVTAGEDGSGRVWSLPDLQLLRVLRQPSKPNLRHQRFDAVAVSPDARLAALGSGEGSNQQSYVYDLRTGDIKFRIPITHISSLAFSPDSRSLAVAISRTDYKGVCAVEILSTADGSVLNKDCGWPEDEKWRRDPSFYKLGAATIAYAADGRLAAAGFLGIRVYDRAGFEMKESHSDKSVGFARSIAFSPDGRTIALAREKSVTLYDPGTLEARVVTAPGVGSILPSIGWSKDGRTLFAGGFFTEDQKNMKFGEPAPIIAWRDGGKGAQFTAAYGEFPQRFIHAIDMTSIISVNNFKIIDIIDIGTQASKKRLKSSSERFDIKSQANDCCSLLVSEDGKRIQWNSLDLITRKNEQWNVFNSSDTSLSSATRMFPGFRDWSDTSSLIKLDGYWEPKAERLRIKMNGRILPLDASNRAAVSVLRDHFVIGWEGGHDRFSPFLSFFEGGGTAVWSQPQLPRAERVNLAADGKVVIGAFEDGTIRWFRAKDGRELLDLFAEPKTGRWVLFTPSGYFTASPGGENLFGWEIDRGASIAPDFFPASKFRDQFNRPDIVERVLDTLDEDEAVKQANQARGGKLKPATAIIGNLPPVVSILSPAEGSSVGDSVSIDYLVRSPSGLPVDAVEALVDGRPPSGGRGLARLSDNESLKQCLSETHGLGRSDISPRGCRGSLLVRVATIAHEIGIYARSGDRVGEVAKIRVVPSAANASVTGRKPNLFALVVGISDYLNPNYALQFASKDARDFSAALENQKGGLYGSVTTRLLADHDASATGIKDGLDWLTKQVTEQDVGLVYLAGHGVLDERDRFYFVAADSDVDRIRATGVPREDIQDALDALPGKALLFLDACHAGAVGTSKLRLQKIDINGVANAFTQAEHGVVMFTASTGRQESEENPAWGNGAFTKAVIEGLGAPGGHAKADFLGKGVVTTSALDTYVSARVKDLTVGAQSPVMIRPATVPDFPLAVAR